MHSSKPCIFPVLDQYHARLHEKYNSQAGTIHEEYKRLECTIRCGPATAKTLPLGGEISLNCNLGYKPQGLQCGQTFLRVSHFGEPSQTNRNIFSERPKCRATCAQPAGAAERPASASLVASSNSNSIFALATAHTFQGT